MNTTPIATTFAASILALSTGCSSATGGVARAPTSPASTSRVSVGSLTRGPAARAHRLAVTIKRAADGDALASTTATVADGREAEFQTSNATDRGETRLVVGLEHRAPDERGPYLVRVQWDERSADGRVVRWAPTVALREGVKSTATIDFGGGDGRRLDVALDPETQGAAEVATSAP